MKALVTGGAGYIGSTIVCALEDAGHDVVILDDLRVGSPAFMEGRAAYVAQIGDRPAVREILRAHPDIAAVVHCAASTSAPESVREPLAYYTNNLSQAFVLIDEIVGSGCDRFLFSSSAAVYDGDLTGAVHEGHPLRPSNPYGESKLMLESVLGDVVAAGGLRSVSLRYFNPIGADLGLRTGPPPRSTSVMSHLVRSAMTGDPFTIHGDDWPTHDGTASRDYVHVVDVARAHVAVLERFDAVTADEPAQVFNVGTGRGTTVRELVDAVQVAVGRPIATRLGPRRPGDPVGGWAEVGKIAHSVGWRAELSVGDGVRDAISWAVAEPTRRKADRPPSR